VFFFIETQQAGKGLGLTLDEKIRAVDTLLAWLTELHKAGQFHGNLKPANVIVHNRTATGRDYQFLVTGMSLFVAQTDSINVSAAAGADWRTNDDG
jgi:hypothetical protein